MSRPAATITNRFYKNFIEGPWPFPHSSRNRVQLGVAANVFRDFA